MPYQNIIGQIDNDFENKHLPEIQRYLRQPSISWTGEGIQEAAELTAEVIRGLGGSAQLVETPGNPVVFGEVRTDLDSPKKTLVMYGMYDCMPVNPEEWVVDPFGGEIIEFEDFGTCLVNRGVVNTKGPFIGFIQACRALIEAEGELPVDLLFVMEGEEELGSRNLRGVINQYRHQLESADGCYFPFFSEKPDGRLAFYLGITSSIGIHLKVKGGAWGGPTTRNIHGSISGVIDSPYLLLLNCWTDMRTKSGELLIPGIYDEVSLSEEDEQLFENLARDVDLKQMKELYNISRFKTDPTTGKEMTGRRLLEEWVFRPILYAPSVPQPVKGVVPYEAETTIRLRLVPKMDRTRTGNLVSNWIIKNYPMIDVDIREGYSWSKMSLKAPIIQAMLRALSYLNKTPQEIWPLMPGGAPFSMFYEIGLPFTFSGLGHGSRQHTNNEYVVIEGKKGSGGLRDFEKGVAVFLKEFAKA